ncbi:MAG TPA: hypothetical protein DD490_21325 [Acidobacteria bacterium]|nr:hypothetical protein [Acidobacteriota bacterium]
MTFLQQLLEKDSSSPVAFHLSGLLEAGESIRAHLLGLDALAEGDRDQYADKLADLQIELYSHLAYHLKELRNPLKRLVDAAYRHDEK